VKVTLELARLEIGIGESRVIGERVVVVADDFLV
jgi:hypothetical protein